MCLQHGAMFKMTKTNYLVVYSIGFNPRMISCSELSDLEKEKLSSENV